MKEKEISATVAKFANAMGPVAERIANDIARELGILKEGRISPPSAKEYEMFMDRIEAEYSKIIGKDVARTIMRL